MSANDTQVGGTHYRTEIQHWDYVLANNIPYLEAQIIKYITRWRKKNGYQDLQKAEHFLRKLMEVNTPIPTGPDIAVDPTQPWPPRPFCTCAISGAICPIHDTPADPGPGYVNQDR